MNPASNRCQYQTPRVARPVRRHPYDDRSFGDPAALHRHRPVFTSLTQMVGDVTERETRSSGAATLSSCVRLSRLMEAVSTSITVSESFRSFGRGEVQPASLRPDSGWYGSRYRSRPTFQKAASRDSRLPFGIITLAPRPPRPAVRLTPIRRSATYKAAPVTIALAITALAVARLARMAATNDPKTNTRTSGRKTTSSNSPGANQVRDGGKRKRPAHHSAPNRP